MLTNRPYRDALSVEDVIAVLEEEKGRQFDPKIAEEAIEVLREEGVGEQVTETVAIAEE